jgi:hypothetical protein
MRASIVLCVKAQVLILVFRPFVIWRWRIRGAGELCRQCDRCRRAQTVKRRPFIAQRRLRTFSIASIPPGTYALTPERAGYVYVSAPTEARASVSATTWLTCIGTRRNRRSRRSPINRMQSRTGHGALSSTISDGRTRARWDGLFAARAGALLGRCGVNGPLASGKKLEDLVKTSISKLGARRFFARSS